MTLDDFNRLPAAEADAALLRCCGSTRWVQAMRVRRPFATLEALHAAADERWWALGPDDWREAFAAHPRIGERRAGDAWSAHEQSGAQRAAAAVLDALQAVNREYEHRFGYTFIVCATGRSGEEMLAIARRRLEHDPETEIRTAAAEQAAITRLRLDTLIDA